MKINKQSNIYIVVYIAVLVIIAGTALAFTSMSLREKQQQNIAADKMRQILASLNIVAPPDSIPYYFSHYITSTYVVDAQGQEIPGDAFAISVADQVKKTAVERQLPVYQATLGNGEVKYILPAYGAGLWGPIWGYIALDDNCSEIYGAYFAHQGETPGLGAEIEKPAFSSQFQGKELFHGGMFIPVEVVKRGQKPVNKQADYVNGVSGGTITSKGVGAMLDNSLSPYAEFLKLKRQK